MRPLTHLVAIVLGIAGPYGFTLWSTTDCGPRSAAHYERAAATDTRPVAVIGRFVDLGIDQSDPVKAVADNFAAELVEHGLPMGGATDAERLIERGWANPEQVRKVLNIVANDDLAMVQQLVFPVSGEGPPRAEIDIFRVADGKFSEHWEVIQAPVPAAEKLESEES